MMNFGEMKEDVFKIVHTDKETGAKISTIYQDNGWICEVWEYPDGTREETYHK